MRGNGKSGVERGGRGRAVGWGGRWAGGIALALGLAGPAVAQDHLLLSEGANQPTPQEFIEIANPTNVTWDLSDVYLSDDADYALLSGTASGAGGPAPNIGSFDFIARFPAGTALGAGEILVVATDGAGFESAYGRPPDFELRATSSTIPDMVLIRGAVSSLSLDNTGEAVALFTWNGQADLVQDLDLMHLGKPKPASASASNWLADKATTPVDGPDADAVSSPYRTDSMWQGVASTTSVMSGATRSAQRIALEAAGGEVTVNGNGVGDHDETSEDLSLTWKTFSGRNPGVVSFSLVMLRDRSTATLATLAGGTTDQLMLRWVADATHVVTGTPTQLTEITITDTGTGPIGSVSWVSVYLDINSNGTLETGVDTPVASSTFATATRTRPLALSAAAQLQGGATDTYFIAYDFAASATLSPGDTFRVKLQVTSTTPAAALIGNPVQGPLHNDIQPILFFTDLNPSGQQATTGTQDILVVGASLQTFGGAVTVHEVKITASGSGDDQQDLARVALYRDTNGNGVFEPSSDLVLKDLAGFPTDNGTITFDVRSPVFTVATSTVDRLFLAYDLGQSAALGSTFRAELTSVSSTATQVTGLPIPSNPVTVVDALPGPTVSRGGGGGGGGGCQVDATAPASRLAWIAALVLALVLWRRGREHRERRQS